MEEDVLGSESGLAYYRTTHNIEAQNRLESPERHDKATSDHGLSTYGVVTF